MPVEEACYHLYRSGVVDNTGRHGVAIALGEAAQAALLACVPISSRLASARLKGTTVNLTRFVLLTKHQLILKNYLVQKD